MRPKGNKMSKAIPVKLDKALLDRIDRLAERLGEPKSTLMRMAMRVGLEHLDKALQADPEKSLSSLIYPSRPDEGYLVEEKTEPRRKKS